MSSNLPKATVLEPQSKDDRTDMKAVEIPLPPPEMWAELDNSASGAPAVKAEAEVAEVPEAKVAREVAKLTFVGKLPQIDVPLQYPFDYQGTIDTITVRRLSVGEIGELLDTRATDLPDLFDIYAIMCGLPAPVLRGLADVDGETVTEVCYDFLPRYFKPRPVAASPSTSPTGEA